MSGHVLVVDQGTTSTRSMIFGPDAALVAMAQEEFPQIFPQPGWVEHDPESLWRTTLSTARQALSRAGVEPSALAGLGITNQRETTLVWSRMTGRPIHNAIVWQDRRTAPALRRPQGSRMREDRVHARGPVARPLFLSDEDRLDPRQCSGRPRGSRTRRLGLRHCRQLSRLAPDQRQGSRHRRHQRLKDPTVQHPLGRMGRRPSRALPHSKVDAA